MSPSINHSYLCKQLILLIEKNQQWEACPELSLEVENGLIPDISVFPSGKLKPDFKLDAVKSKCLPELVIEIISPSQSIHDLMLKADKFLLAGIQQVWTLEPYGKLAYVSSDQGGDVKRAESLIFDTLQIDLNQLFSN